MGYCTASDVGILIDSELDPEVVEQVIALADDELDRQLGGTSATSAVKKRCSMYLAAAIIADKTPDSYTTGNIRIDYGAKAREWRAQVKMDIQELRAGSAVIKSSEYQSINEDARYPRE